MTIDSLQYKVDSLAYLSYQLKIDDFNKQLVITKDSIITINHWYEKKLYNVLNMSNDSSILFFTNYINSYKTRYDSLSTNRTR